MKKKLTVVFFMLYAVLPAAFSQKAISDGTLTYNIAIQSQGGTASSALLTIYLKGLVSRTDMSSNLGSEKTIHDAKSGTTAILKEYSGQKLMITLTRDNWKQKNQYFRNLKFNIDNTVQSMAGYTCRKATAKTEDGKDFIVYFLPDVTLVNKEYNNAFAQIPGIPVYYELESGKLKFTYTLTGISYDNIPANKFEVPKTGFRVMTYDENQQLKKG